MKPILLSLMIFALSACTVSQQYYLPVDQSLRVEGTICGTVPWGRADIPLTPGINLSVSAGPVDGRISASLQLPIPSGMTIRFLAPELRFIDQVSGQMYVASISRWKVGVYGSADNPGYFEYIESDALLEGKGRNAAKVSDDEPYLKNDLFSATAASQALPAPAITMILPAIEVNGILVPSVQVPLYLVKASGTMSCVQ